MNTEFLTLVPGSIQTKVGDIERAIGREVKVRRDSMGCYKGNNATPPLAVCVCDDRGNQRHVEIILSAQAVPHNLIHEILHAYRTVVLGVPRLVSPENRGSSLTEALENDAEHLFIVPEEMALANEAKAFWEKQAGQHFDELSDCLSSHGTVASELPAIRHGFLRHWLFVTRVLSDWPRRPALRELLQRRSWQTAADTLVNELANLSLDKVQVLRAYLRSGSLQLEKFRLRSWDPQRFGAVEDQIPLE